ncbi:hypothetical protein [Shewanella algae]|jgi:glycerol kinase|uniref:hypothetical protein n=1 Tax=Shewanella algae TaxID=38313 RepID=UPI0011830E74|nr:hypothetical protein [Shewanella algae]MBO2558960.1 hypothetical protein [Shewanella algae]MBO2575887.1 hypothetical protein [Shewanella algae]TVO83380.1 hypothetical protein AYI80_19380 [Shewanella algae]TXS83031.1 hypothetical protein AYI81_20490 [Shewanella algae]
MASVKGKKFNRSLRVDGSIKRANELTQEQINIMNVRRKIEEREDLLSRGYSLDEIKEMLS